MLFSCKITHSVITYLDRRGEDLESLYEKCDWPAEFLRDPSSWLEAEKMEAILKQIDFDYGRERLTVLLTDPHNEGIIAAVGHQSKDLRAWGVLDSVLRMVPTPKELFAQPERFLSYFVSPAPPIGEIRRGADSVSFVLPISEEQFPFVTTYLRAVLEALPTYIAKPMASVKWSDSRVVISWSEHQVSLFGEDSPRELSLHPELVDNVLNSLETSQKELEVTKLALIAKTEEVERMKVEFAAQAWRNGVQPGVQSGALAEKKTLEASAESIESALHDLYRLGDYFARGQQLVTLLIGQGRQTRQVQEAMRRVDWDFVATEGPRVVKSTIAALQSVREDNRARAVEAAEPTVSTSPNLKTATSNSLPSMGASATTAAERFVSFTKETLL